MKTLLILFLLAVPAFSNTDKNLHICFFELDNTTTSTNFRGKNIENTKVHVFKPEKGERTAQAFKRMIEATQTTGKTCDSLVISGHHTGDWYGKKGKLKLKQLEALSCDPKYRDWFSKIQALWLDGCNTVTDNAVLESSPPSPDSETVRVVGKEIEEEGHAVRKSHITSTSQAYSLSLDQNTPLSSRYLRMFPNTKVYGFNGATPLGEEGKNQTGKRSFIAEHLSHLGQALNAEEAQAETLNQVKTIERGLKAIFSQEYCDEQQEAWEKVGQESGLKPEAIENLNYELAYQLGCDLTLAKQLLDNPESREARQALAKKIKKSGYTGEVLNLANKILNNPDSKNLAIKLAKQLINKTLDKILKEDSKFGRTDHELSLSHLLFSNIYDTWSTAKKYKTSDLKFFMDVKKKLKSDTLTSSLQSRVESSQTSSLRKVDYIKFYKELNDNKSDNWTKEAIKNLVEKASNLFPDLESPRQDILPLKTKTALSLSVVDQLLQYDLLSPEQIKSIRNSEIFKDKSSNFSLNVFADFGIAMGKDSLETLLGESTNEDYKSAAIQALTRHHFDDPEKLDSLIVNEIINNKNYNHKDIDRSLLPEIHYQLLYKSDQERIVFLSDRINNSEYEDVKKLLSIYVQMTKSHRTDKENEAICKAITESHLKQTAECP